MRRKLEGKVAVITGAGSGIGKAMAILFAGEGARVVAADVVSEAVGEVVSEIGASGGEAVATVTDVALESDVGTMIDTAVSRFGRLDILCNNAGVLDGMTPITEVTDEFFHRVMGINLVGPFRACRKAIPIMVEQGGGVILNTASSAGLFGCRAGFTYTVSKHGVVGLTKNIAFTYADKGIRCNAICPGGVETSIIGGEYNEFGFSRMQLGVPAMPRMGKPEEVGNVALMLVSDDASFVNGVAIPVDAGWMAY
jgi:NAD(P)-dependent dehydrogenase (short-subunit alcohol dehydrogenase family)